MLQFALAGNPNSGKTTLFNSLTGSTAHVGNWPGVTVDKREGVYKKLNSPVAVVDLPGIYSLSPYSPEEVIARNFILDEKPDCVIDVVDATNLERNLYLTTQLLEIDVPVVVALNMIDAVKKSGDTIDAKKLEQALGVPVVAISALKNEGIGQLMERAYAASAKKRQGASVLSESSLAHVIDDIRIALKGKEVKDPLFHAVKLVEGDEIEVKNHPAEAKMAQEFKAQHAGDVFGGDFEAKAADARYKYITAHFSSALHRSAKKQGMSRSDKADRVLTHRIWGIPIFIVILFFMFHFTFGEDLFYLNTIVGWFNGGEGFCFDVATGSDVLDAFVAVFFSSAGISTPGAILFNLTGFVTDQIGALIELGLDTAAVYPWAKGLLFDGIWGGVSSVISFVPQILFMFLILSILEDTGYMARVAFILDRAFRKFGLTGRAFIPMVMGFGCSVPAAINTRTLSDDKERIMTTRVIPFFTCGAKAPILAAICGALASAYTGVNADLIVFLLYLFGMAMAVIMVAFMRQTSMRGEVAPFIMELPAYHLPRFSNLMAHLWDKLKHYIKKAFTIILASCVVICWVFVVAAVTGLIAKENVVSTFYILAAAIGAAIPEWDDGESGIGAVLALMDATGITWQALIAFTVFNMLTIPCFAAAATVKAETPKGKFKNTVGFWMLTSYVTASLVYVVLSWWWTAFIVAAVLALVIAYFALRNRGKIQLFGKRKGTGTALRQ